MHRFVTNESRAEAGGCCICSLIKRSRVHDFLKQPRHKMAVTRHRRKRQKKKKKYYSCVGITRKYFVMVFFMWQKSFRGLYFYAEKGSQHSIKWVCPYILFTVRLRLSTDSVFYALFIFILFVNSIQINRRQSNFDPLHICRIGFLTCKDSCQ